MTHIEGFIGRGYELVVKNGDWRDATTRPFHALVWRHGHTETSHNFLGASVREALEGLEKYLERVAGPTREQP